MKLFHGFSVLLASAVDLLSVAGTTLTKADLMRDFVPLIENKTLQAISVGVI